MGFLEHYPDLEAGVTPSAVHPSTGAFAEPSHETAFAAQLFRTVFPCHVALLALISTILIRAWLSAPLDLFVSTAALCMTLSLVGRVLTHYKLNVVRGQRLCACAWTAQAIVWCVISVGVYVRAPRAECALLRSHDLAGFAGLTGALVNGSHGLRFWHKLGLIGLMLQGSLCAIASFGEVSLAGVSMVLAGFVVAHMMEVHLRHNYLETRRLEERNEQLRAEKERLLYDVQRRGRPLDDADDRSAIRRGLQAGCSKRPSLSADGSTLTSTSSDRSGTKPSCSDLSPPPGPPSSNSSESSTTAEQAKPTEPDSNVADLVARHVEKEVAHLLLSCARGGHANHQCESTEASTKEACTSATATACSTSAAPISSPSVALTHTTATSSAAAEAELVGSYLAARAATEDELNERVPAPEPAPGISLDTDSLVASGGVSTPEEAILVARRDILVAQDQIQVQRVVRTLGMALGASRIETGTAKALHAVLLQLAQPGVSDIEAYRSTGASRSNFTKWRRRVQQILERQRRASIRARGSALIYEHERVNGATYLPATAPPSVHASGSHGCATERLESYYY